MKFALAAGARPQVRLSLIYPALALLLAVFAIAPLTYPGSFQTQTGFSAVYNLMDLHAHPGLAWAPTFGTGFDLLRMDGALPYLAAEVLHLFGFSFAGAINAVYALGFLLSGLGMFALARKMFGGDAAGLPAAAVYVYFPYHLAAVFVRGAFGEAAAWALLPFALLALYALPPRGTGGPRAFAAAAAVWALLLLTQPGLALLSGLLALAWFHHRRAAAAVALGLAVGGALALPAVAANNAAVASEGFTPAFVYPFQFLTASWGSAVPQGNYLDQFPFQIGIAGLGLTVLALALAARATDANPTRRTVWIAVVAAAVLLLLMTPFAAPLWTFTPLTWLVRYPFELLAFIGLALSLAAGSIVVSDARLADAPLLATLTAIPLLAVYAYLTPDFLNFTPTQPPLAVFNQNEIALLDARISRPPGVLHHGATVELDLQWQALREVDHDYTVFVHVMDDGGKTWGSEDAKPQDGKLPTIKWPVGRVISDTHTVQIDLAGPPEGYHLEIGLYTAASGERAATDSGATEIRIDENQ